MPHRLLAAVSAAALLPAVAGAAIVNIDATHGFNYTNGGGSDPAPQPGQQITFIGNPPTLSLAAGVYGITNATGLAGSDPNLTAWSYNTGTSSWTWGFVVATSSGTVIDYENAASGNSKSDVANNPLVQNFASTFTLTAPTNVSFTLRDYYVSDNAGGVSLNVQALTPSAAPEPVAWAMLVVGFGLVGLALRRSNLGSATFAGAMPGVA